MKKEIFILLTASLVVSSCVDNEDIYKNPDNSKKDQVLTLSLMRKVDRVVAFKRAKCSLLPVSMSMTF